MSNVSTQPETVVIPTESVPPAGASTDPRSKTDEAVEQAIDNVVDLGRLWARHGLTIGKMALETSAASLATTAKLLSSLSDALTTEHEEPKASQG